MGRERLLGSEAGRPYPRYQLETYSSAREGLRLLDGLHSQGTLQLFQGIDQPFELSRFLALGWGRFMASRSMRAGGMRAQAQSRNCGHHHSRDPDAPPHTSVSHWFPERWWRRQSSQVVASFPALDSEPRPPVPDHPPRLRPPATSSNPHRIIRLRLRQLSGVASVVSRVVSRDVPRLVARLFPRLVPEFPCVVGEVRQRTPPVPGALSMSSGSHPDGVFPWGHFPVVRSQGLDPPRAPRKVNVELVPDLCVYVYSYPPPASIRVYDAPFSGPSLRARSR